MANTTTAPRVWFITGSSSGIGLAMTEYILSQGQIAVATLRTPSAIAHLETKYPKTQLLVLKLDVTKTDDIVNGFKAAVEAFGRIDVVFNNAGFGIYGEIENTSLDGPSGARQLFDVNFWGATNVEREAVRVLRDGGKPGHIINVSSLVGLKPYVLTGYYAAAKSALNGLSEGLAQELDPAWKIKITIIDMGSFKTEGQTKAVGTLPAPHPAYASNPSLPTSQFRAMLAKDIPFPTADPHKAVKAIHRMSQLDEKEIPLHFPLGLEAIRTAETAGKVYIEAAQKWKEWSSDLN